MCRSQRPRSAASCSAVDRAAAATGRSHASSCRASSSSKPPAPRAAPDAAASAGSAIARSREVYSATTFSTVTGSPARSSHGEVVRRPSRRPATATASAPAAVAPRRRAVRAAIGDPDPRLAGLHLAAAPSRRPAPAASTGARCVAGQAPVAGHARRWSRVRPAPSAPSSRPDQSSAVNMVSSAASVRVGHGRPAAAGATRVRPPAGVPQPPCRGSTPAAQVELLPVARSTLGAGQVEPGAAVERGRSAAASWAG